MFVSRLILLLIILCLKTGEALSQRFGNEWIDTKQSYFRIPISKTGFYRITGQQLLDSGIRIDSIHANAFQIFRRGKELTIGVENEAFNKITLQSSIIFYGQNNDGATDSALYIRPSLMPHPYFSLYSDTASYFLTWQKSENHGKRIVLEDNMASSDTVSYHLSESLQLYTAFYSTGNFYPPRSNFDTGIALSTYDVGEGWTGQELKNGQWGIFPTQTENPFLAQFNLTKAEMTLVGRTAGNHEAEIWAGTPEKLIRKLATVPIVDYNVTKITLQLGAGDVSRDGKLVISVLSANNTGSVSVSAIRWIYPQKTIISPSLLQKEFRFDSSMNEKTWKVENAKKLRFFDCTDPFELRELKPDHSGIRISETKNIIAVNEFLRPVLIEPVRFKEIDTSRINYLIISHPIIRNLPEDPVEAYAAYRASEKGGNYRPLIMNSQDIYDQFNYGESGPLGIRNMIKWLNQHNQLKFVFIIGKSVDPQTARKSANPRNIDQVPNAGWPGSDLALTTEPGEDAATYIPSVPVGRINAENPEQVWNYLRKVKALESEPTSAPWRKNILHLSGGRSASELALFQEYVHSFSRKLERSELGALITTVSKKTDEPVEQFPLDQPVNKGVALMTLFGHSGLNVTDVDIGYASDSSRNYRNAPFYPAVIVNGCATGSIFYSKKTISSDWIFAKKSGAVLFLATTFNGVSTSLKRYTDSFYEVLADSSFMSEPFGNIQKEAIRRKMLKNPGISDKIAAQQMTLQGDPAIRIFPARLPDYAIDSTSLIFLNVSGKPFTVRDDTIDIKLKISNYGRQKNLHYTLSISREKDSLIERYQYTFSATADSIRVEIPNSSKNPGKELWTFTVDPDNEIEEENEHNNIFTTEIFLTDGGAIPLIPLDGYVSNTPEIELIAQIPEDRKGSEVVFEWDISDTFSTSLQSNVLAKGKIARKKISLPDSTKIFWRAFLKGDEKYPSKHRSVQYEFEAFFVEQPEVIVNMAEAFPTEVQEGAPFKTSITFQNITNTPFLDSITIQTNHKTEKGSTEKFVKIAPLLANEIRNFPVETNTLQLAGTHGFSINFNHSKLPEEIYANNSVSFSFNVVPDLISPVLSVSVDRRQLHDLEVVSSKPLITVQLSDENKYLIRTDTTGIEIWLTEECPNCSTKKLDLKSAATSFSESNIFEISLKLPNALPNGIYLLLVKAKDLSGNFAKPYQIRFRVQNIAAVADAGVSPNPASQCFRFYLDLEGEKTPELWTIQIKDIAGRNIKQLEKTPHLGKNEIRWFPSHLVPGILLYEMNLSDSDLQSKKKTHPGLRGKLIWTP